MSGIGRPDAVELRNAARDCTDRGLMVAARWAAEQLLAIPPELRSPSEEQVVDQENPESDRLDMARAYLQQKQFARAAHVLRQSTGNTACFVRGYAKFMAGEKYRADNCVAATKGEKCTEDITDLLELRDEVDAMLKQIGDGADGFMYYLKGIVLKSLDLADDARQALLQSVWLYPCNWSAWQDLGALCPDVDALNGMSLPSHWMTLFFHSYIWLDLQQPNDPLSNFNLLKEMLPDSKTVDAHIGVAKYNTHEFFESEEVFDTLMQEDPDRLEDLEVFSNILHNDNNAAGLSVLAQHATKSDKHRAETCTVTGNYFSLKNEHERAVIYFKRALFLDPAFVCAWTLMGHEYCEMKNIDAAVACYHKAVSLNPREYRAWHGLGVAYEDLKMPLNALYYYTKATELRRDDQKCWTSLGRCYESLQCHAQANQCFERADSLE